jgi:hypothetical protein
MMPAGRHHDGPESEDEMNGYATHELVKIRQDELMAEAAHHHLVKEARLARGTAVPARRPLIWLRDAARGLATRLVTFKGARAGGH